MRVNLFDETTKILRNHGHSWKDVHFVSLKVNEKDYYVNVKDFSLMSAKYEYSNSFGCVWVPFSLKIAGEDWWLERNEYDGSEWWEFKQKPLKPLEEISVYDTTFKECFLR